MKRPVWMLLIPVLLAGCDQLAERAGFPNQAKLEADGKAIGGACRHAGRGLEDCYRLNKSASKAAIYAGWKEMNEYMAKNNMQAIPPTITPFAIDAAKKKSDEEDAHDVGAEAEKTGKSGKSDKEGKESKKSDSHAKDAEH